MVKLPVSWEKTVEWEFVKNCLPSSSIQAPLDGEIELSDALIGADSQWLLIEFKHSSADCVDEKKKYPLWSRKRARILASRHYARFESALEQVIAANADDSWWWEKVVAWETALGKGAPVVGAAPDMQGPVDSKDLDDTPAAVNEIPSAKNASGQIFQTAQAAMIEIATRYISQPWGSDAPKEPHYFVFASANTFHPLTALPYWSDWARPKSKGSRGCPPTNAKDLWAGRVEFAEFVEYVQLVADARGYDQGSIDSDSLGDRRSPEALVFGHVRGLGKDESGRSIVLTLKDFARVAPNLIQALNRTKISPK